MDQQDVIQIFRRHGAVVLNDHLVYTSGKHGDAYVNKDGVYPYTQDVERICRAIAEEFVDANVEVVIAPATGGIVLSQGVARHLSELTGRDVLSVYSEKVDGTFVIKRGYDKIVAGRRTLVVEDILNSGGSARGTVVATRTCGGEVIGVAALWNRNEVTTKMLDDVPLLFSLVNMKLQVWPEADCPSCAQGIPVNTDVGHGRAFLARIAADG